jgi:ribosomal subunit interface protein
MQLTVKGKQLDVGDALRAHVAESLNAAVGKYFENSIEANVVISKDARLFTVDIVVHAGRNIVLHSEAEASEPYPAFDQACDRIAKRLRRYKRRLKERHAEPLIAVTAARYQVLRSDDDQAVEEAPAQPIVVAEMETSIDTLSVGDAVMRLELGEKPFVLFRNGGGGALNLVYRREDGNIGWIDPRPDAGA